MRNRSYSQYNSTNNNGGKGKQSNSKFSKSTNSNKGKWNNNNKNKKTSYTKTKEKKFAPMVTGPSHYATYDEVHEDFCNYVQKNLKYGYDMAQSLRDGTKLDLNSDEYKPKLKKSSNTDPAKKDAEDEEFKIQYVQEVKTWNDRKNTLDENCLKCYTKLLTEYCTKGMRYRIKEHPEYESHIINDPFKLTKTIKTLVHDVVLERSPWEIKIAIAKCLFNIRQYPDEPMTDYIIRFKEAAD